MTKVTATIQWIKSCSTKTSMLQLQYTYFLNMFFAIFLFLIGFHLITAGKYLLFTMLINSTNITTNHKLYCWQSW